MITVQSNDIAVPKEYLQRLLYSNELIRALARQLVAGQVEGHLEMMSDYPSEYANFSEVEQCVKGAKETVVDYVEDLLAEFRDQLYAEIANVDIKVESVVFTSEGAADANVFVSSK